MSENASVAACLAASADGRIWHPEVPVLGSDDDRQVLEAVRSQADVLLYGAGTARADSRRRIQFRYERYAAVAAARLARPVPPIAVLCRSLDFDFSSQFWTSDCPIAVVRDTSSAPSASPPEGVELLDVKPEASGKPPLAVVVRAVAAWARRVLDGAADDRAVRVLCEGGGGLVGSLVRAGLLDELFLTVTPWVLGDGGTPAVSGTVAPARLALREWRAGADGEIFLRYCRPGAARWAPEGITQP
ncbi:dihydrofolate reductase family protein [Amycolatopsis sp. NPDC004079]|uniref:dihydrofolate reductase family protein n=1 Tax=Amycolatopsis sp. NPDC004079 TaxID=3154549 RepID=UPI0033B5CB5E